MSNKITKSSIVTGEVLFQEVIFISYSRRDIDFVNRLIPLLEQRNKSYRVWIDTEGILKSSIWSAEIEKATDNAIAFIFVLTKFWVESEYCINELEYAERKGKKIIPLIKDSLTDLDELYKDSPEELKRLEKIKRFQGIPWEDQKGENTNVEEIINAIEEDIDWYSLHANLLEQSHYWDKKIKKKGKRYLLLQKNRHLLLRGSELRRAESWLDKGSELDKNGKKKYTVTHLQLEFITASRKGAAIRLWAVAIPALVLLILLLFIKYKIVSTLNLSTAPDYIAFFRLQKSATELQSLKDGWEKAGILSYAIVKECIDFLVITFYVLVLSLVTFYFSIYLERRSRVLSIIGIEIFVAIIFGGVADIIENYTVLNFYLSIEDKSLPDYFYWFNRIKILLIGSSLLYIIAAVIYLVHHKAQYKTQKV